MRCNAWHTFSAKASLELKILTLYHKANADDRFVDCVGDIIKVDCFS